MTPIIVRDRRCLALIPPKPGGVRKRNCGKPVADAPLCEKHLKLAQRRLQNAMKDKPRG